jgi:hypothetical protein
MKVDEKSMSAGFKTVLGLTPLCFHPKFRPSTYLVCSKAGVIAVVQPTVEHPDILSPKHEFPLLHLLNSSAPALGSELDASEHGGIGGNRDSVNRTENASSVATGGGANDKDSTKDGGPMGPKDALSAVKIYSISTTSTQSHLVLVGTNMGVVLLSLPLPAAEPVGAKLAGASAKVCV